MRRNGGSARTGSFWGDLIMSLTNFVAMTDVKDKLKPFRPPQG
jgi:hypothetical protein